MPIVLVIPLIIFLASFVAHIWYIRKARNLLIDRHPDTYLAIERASYAPGHGVYKFIFGRKYRLLDDEELNRCVRNMRWSYFGIFAAMLAVPALLALVLPAS